MEALTGQVESSRRVIRQLTGGGLVSPSTVDIKRVNCALPPGEALEDGSGERREGVTHRVHRLAVTACWPSVDLWITPLTLSGSVRGVFCAGG